MLGRCIAFVLIAVMTFVGLPQPTQAAGIIGDDITPSLMSGSYTIKNYQVKPFEEEFVSEKTNVAGEVIEDTVKIFGTAGLALAICYGTDALATTVFPPAAAMAPVCNLVIGGTTGANIGKKMVRSFVH